jgi:hypothetical protein
MLTIRTLGVAALAAAVVLPFGSVARAAEPTLTDIAGCNEEAAARAGAAALPRATIVEGERELPKAGSREKSDPTGSIVTESADPLAKGMDAQRAKDPAYRAAYRACMQTRLSPSR